MKKIVIIGLVLWLFNPSVCYAMENWEESISIDEVEETYREIQGEEDEFSFGRYVEDVVNGEAELSLHDIGNRIAGQISEQFEEQKDTFIRILALGLIAGIFINFSGAIGEKDVSETGFHVVFLLLFSLMAAGFHAIYLVAKTALSDLLIFMKVLIPSFSMTLCLGNSSGTSVAFYETMLIAVSLLEMVMVYVFLPGVQVYFFLNFINLLAEGRFSKMTELIRTFLKWCIKVLFGLLIGYQGIQGMLLPVMDKVKGNVFLQTAKGLPGVGNTMGSVADTMLGSGMLIKSAVGVGGIICIIGVCLYPILKVLVYMMSYRVLSAVVQPVSDKRIVKVLHAASESGSLLLSALIGGALMFLLSITIVVVCTNIG